MADVETVGAQDFAVAALKLRAMGKEGGGLRRELNRNLLTAAEPMTKAVITHLDQYLPSGYAPILAAGLTVRPSISARGSSAGLRLVGKAKGVKRGRQIGVINLGILRHPVFGNSNVWVNQRVRPGFWSTPLADSSEEPKKAIQQAVRITIEKLA